MKNAAFSGLVSRWLGYGLLLSMPLLAWGADDFGDAPETYGDASHVIVSGLYLGNNPPDAEAASQYSINAFGDADPRSAMLDGVSVSWRDSGDEDGAPRQPVGDYIPLFPVLKMTAMQYRVDLTVTNATASAATLFGWIDFDGNGQFDPDEAASAAVPDGTGTGTVTLDWEVPVDIRLGTTFARFRLTSDPAVTTATPAGAASSGEVEDYPLAVAMDIPPESTSVSIVSGVTPLACQKPVFSDDFDDLASSLGQFIAPRRVGPTISVRDWTIAGGGSDTYASITAGDGGAGAAIYLGNGAVRRIDPPLPGSGFAHDVNGRITNVIDAVELRDAPDDISPGTTLASNGTASHWGPGPVTLSRSFATTPGTVYRLYFRALPEDVGGGFVTGAMRLDVPGGSIHFRIPGSKEAPVDYAVEFTATQTSSSVTFVNYGHVNSSQEGWCDPASEYVKGAWCTVGGGELHGNELIIDDVALVESYCDPGAVAGVVYQDVNASGAYDAGADSGMADISVRAYDDRGTADLSDDRLMQTAVTGADGAYHFAELDSGKSWRIEADIYDADIPAGLVNSTRNPLTALAVSAGQTLGDQNFGFTSQPSGTCPSGYVMKGETGHAAAVAGNVGATDTEQALGAPDAVGATASSANAALVNNGDTLTLALAQFAAGGTSLELSLARNNTKGRIRVETSADGATYTVLGTYGTAGSWPGGPLLRLERVSVLLPAEGARYVRFVRENGGVLVDAVSYDRVCIVRPALAAITGTVFVDYDGNDRFEPGAEPGLAAIGVRLYNTWGTDDPADDGLLGTGTTSSGGEYRFSGLPADTTYRIVLDTGDADIPADLKPGTPETLIVNAGTGLIEGQDFGFDPPEYVNSFCVAPQGSTGLLELGDMPSATVAGNGVHAYPDRVLPGLGTVDVMVEAAGGAHAASLNALDGDHQQSWLNQSLPASGAAIYLEAYSSGTLTVSYRFDQPTGNVDLLLLDIDDEDRVTLAAVDALGRPVSDFRGWRYRAGDMSVWANPDPVAEAPRWDAGSATVTSMDDGNDNRSFAILTPDVLLSELKVTFRAPAVTGRHVYTTLHSTLDGRDGETGCTTGSISGRLYVDTNGNDRMDAVGERPVGGAAVALYDQRGSATDGRDDRLVATTVAQPDGRYAFQNVGTGLTYRIEVAAGDAAIPAGYLPGTPNPLTDVHVSADTDTGGQDFGFDPPVGSVAGIAVAGEFRFDDCDGSGSWNLDASGYGNSVTGTPSVVVSDFKSYGCTAMRNSSGNLEVPHQSGYELDQGAVSILLYDNQDIWNGSRLLEKGSTAAQALMLNVNQAGSPTRGTISARLNGNTISTGETYFTVRQDGSVDDGQWTHVLLSFGPGGMKLYVNGALKGSNPYTGGIGSVAGNFRLPSLNGYFDEFYIFSEQPDDEAANAIYRNLLNNRNLDGSLRTCACERGENYCVVPDGQTGNLETTDIPATPVSGSGGFSYPAQVLPGLGRVDVTVDQTGGMHHLSDTAIDTAVKQQSWLNENLPASGSALYLEPASGSVTRVTYDFDQPTGNVDLLLLDIDAEDSVTISALDGAGNPVSRFTGWRYRAGDMSVWQSPDAAPPSWNPASATVSSTDTGDNHRSFALLTPDTLVTRIVIRFASPAAGRNVYATLHSTERGRHGNDACLGIQKDRSDAPASYGEATHDIPDSATYYLGSRLPDADSVSLMQAGAMGDDTSGFDDDEGVSIPWLGRSTTVAIKARVNGTGGYLQGWIDWNGNGSFADPGEQVAMDLQDNDGNGRISIPVMVPATATRAETYARFRWSSRAGLNVTDPAPDGEVEDYVVRVQAFCPAPVQLDWSNVTWTPGNKNNAYWVAGKTISLTVSDPAGALVTTPYPAPGNGVYYQGDEAAPSNTLMVAGKLPVMGTSNHLETEIRVGVSGIGVDGLHFRLFDADGEVDKFDRQEKYVITGYFRNRVVLPVLTGSSAHIINGNTVLGDYPTRPAGGNSDESVLHVAFPQTVDRVVIDFSINNGALITDSEPGFGIHNLAFCGVGPFSDYSDAPASYGRAEHLLSDPGFFLGQGAPDADTQALDSMDALGDDNNAVDDEDGVSIGRLIAGESAWINVRTAGSGGYLQAWFDWNADGDFADASERVATNLSASASTGDIGFNVRVPLDAVPGTTYSRFRWSRDVSLSPSAPASDGEVEDYAVVIHPTAGPVVEGSCSVDGGQDVLFVVDNSGSISEAEYAAFQNSMLQVGSRLLADSPASRVAVAHYAGSMPYQQQMVYIERDFSAAPMTTPVRQFATGGVFDSSARSDYLAVALQFLRFALDGDPDTTHDQLVGPIHELDRSGARPLQIIVFSDAYANSGSSVTLDLDNMAYEPGDGSNYAVFNLLKRQGVTFSVVFIQDSSDAREEFAAIASVGGAYTGEVADNIADPEVNQATPRRLFIKGSGFALTGVEVEQIVTTAQENCISADYSDAPASYGSAFHTGDDSLYLGSIAPDRELEARTGPAADGDDTSGVDDEDGVQVPLLTAGSSVTVPVAVTGAGYLQAWVDWNRDGDFQDAGEQVAQDLQDNAAGDTDSRTGWISFEVGVPAGIPDGYSMARFRWASVAGIGTVGPAADGEVEDHRVVIGQVVQRDYGDAPASFGGGSQVISADLHIGAGVPDAEDAPASTLAANGNVKPDANGDDASGQDDEELDGLVNGEFVALPLLLETAGSYQLAVPVHNVSGAVAKLMGWIDFDKSGTFEAGESAEVEVPEGGADVMLDWPALPADLRPGTRYLRLRLSSETSLAGDSAAVDSAGLGEVEDYLIGIAVNTGRYPQGELRLQRVDGEASCAVPVFSDNFDDLAPAYWGPARDGQVAIRDWSAVGGGSDTPANIIARSAVASGKAVYFGNGQVRRMYPEAGFVFDADGLVQNPPQALEIRDRADDLTPAETAGLQDFGGQPLRLSRTFNTTPGVTYHLGFEVLSDTGGSGAPSGIAGLEVRGLATRMLHLEVPDTAQGVYYRVFFVADSDSTTISFVSYGQFAADTSAAGQSCFPHLMGGCTVGGSAYADGVLTSTLILDNVTLTEGDCSPATGAVSGRVFEDMNYGGGAGRSFGAAGTAGINNALVEVYDSEGQMVAALRTAATDGEDGIYRLPELVPGNYFIRVVSDSVDSVRRGSNGTELGVMTYRSTGTAAVMNEVGGRNPLLADAGANRDGARLDVLSFRFAGGGAGWPAGAGSAAGIHQWSGAGGG